MNSLRLILVADDPLARAGLAGLLTAEPNCHLLDQFSSAALPDRAGWEVGDPLPDAVVWDVGWTAPATPPDWNELAIPVAALVSDAVDAATVWGSGVQALLLREEITAEAIIAAGRAIGEGLMVLDPALAPSLLPPFLAGETAVPAEPLTPREVDVLHHLAEGLTNKAIAQRLEISDHTVKFHVNAILRKLQAQSRTEAVVRATRLGLILL